MTSLMIKGLQMDVGRLQSRLSASEAMCEKMAEELERICKDDFCEQALTAYEQHRRK